MRERAGEKSLFCAGLQGVSIIGKIWVKESRHCNDNREIPYKISKNPP